jgi:hypothetical protein
MTTIKAFIKRYPLLSFYALAFAITWGGLIMVVGGTSEILGSPEALDTRLPLVLLAWLDAGWGPLRDTVRRAVLDTVSGPCCRCGGLDLQPDPAQVGELLRTPS